MENKGNLKFRPTPNLIILLYVWKSNLSTVISLEYIKINSIMDIVNTFGVNWNPGPL